MSRNFFRTHFISIMKYFRKSMWTSYYVNEIINIFFTRRDLLCSKRRTLTSLHFFTAKCARWQQICSSQRSATGKRKVSSDIKCSELEHIPEANAMYQIPFWHLCAPLLWAVPVSEIWLCLFNWRSLMLLSAVEGAHVSGT